MKCIFSDIILVLIGVISLKRKDKLFLYLSIWYAFVLLDLRLSEKSLGKISAKFDAVFSIFLLCVFGTYLVISYLLRNSKKEIVIVFPKIISFDKYIKIVISISALFAVIGFMRVGRVSWSSLRALIAAEDASFHSGISTALLASAMYYANLHGTKKQKIIVAVSMILIGVLSTSKSFLVIDALFIVPWYVDGFKLKIRYIVIAFVFAVLGFYIYNGLTGRIVGESSSMLSNILFTMNGYLLGGIAVFQRFLDGNVVTTSPGWYLTGNFVTNVASLFSSIYYQKPIELFIISSIGIGALYGLLSAKMKSLNFVKVYSLYPIFFIFFADLFIKGAAQWVCFFLAGILLFVIEKPKRV